MSGKETRVILIQEAIISAGAIRTRPIVLTSGTLMVGAFAIIWDPIFQGLAVSLLFGAGAATLLTLVVIPLLYFSLFGGRGNALPPGSKATVQPEQPVSTEFEEASAN